MRSDKDKNSLNRIQGLLAMLWIENLTPTQKRNYCKAIEKTNIYSFDVYRTQKLYDYYKLYNWPIALIKLNKLKQKYNKL